MLYQTIVENQIRIQDIFFPTSIMIKLTNRCNLLCAFCSQGDAKNVDIDIDTVRKILDEARMYGVSEIVYSGGEPLLYPQFREVISYGKQLGLVQTLVTNGIYLDKYMTDIMGKISVVGISLHGNEEIHDAAVGVSGAYRKVAQNIELLTRTEGAPQVTLNFTITENNAHSINDVIRFSKTHGCQLSVARLNQIGKSAHTEAIGDTIDKFFENLADNNEVSVSNVIPPINGIYAMVAVPDLHQYVLMRTPQ